MGVLSIAASALSVLGIAFFAASIHFGWFTSRTELIVLVPILSGSVLLPFLGLGLGIGNLAQKGKWRRAAIIGCTLNGLVLTSICVLSVIATIQSGGFHLGISDGCRFGTAKAWTDQNGNGVWDLNEMPLAGVKFEVINSPHDYRFVDSPTSDENGEASLTTFPYTCDSLHRANLVIQVTPPHGYRTTTPDQVVVTGDEFPNALGRTYLFGFQQQASP